jgi:carboxyl-terminal processing protease
MPEVLVASNIPDEDEDETSASKPTQKPSVTVDDQLTKALDLLKNKAA